MIKDYHQKGREIHARITHFDLRQTFACGQSFRWREIGAERYLGLSLDHILDIEHIGDRFVFRGTDHNTFETYWMNYLDLKRDYGAIQEAVSVEPSISKAAKYARGLRILLQEEWETLVSFLFSSNNNVKRISGLVENLSRSFGRPRSYESHTFYTFPRPEELAGASCEDLAPIRCGYRADYLVDAVAKVLDATVDPGSIRRLPYEEAVKHLRQIKGVGPKVADCIVLYGGGKHESYPVDVWVKRVTESIYLEGRSTKEAQIKERARELWGDLAGFAQQYLFYYAREHQMKAGEII